jgi:murein DD-endopeptidase MepM/ murein hydrolase activator NlpD
MSQAVLSPDPDEPERGPTGEPPRDVPLEELSVEPPAVTERSNRPLAASVRPGLGEMGIRPAPQLARDAITQRIRSAPSAPRVPPASWTPRPTPAALPLAGKAPEPPESVPLPPLRGRPPSAHLSPRLIAVFGGLFGLATVASAIALLIHVAPPEDERTSIEMQVVASASPTADPHAPLAPPKKRERVPIPGPWRLSELEKDPTVRVVSGVMERESFVKALADKGVPKAQVYRILKALDGIRKFDKTGRKDQFRVALDKATKSVRAFEYEVSRTEVYQAREDAGGLLTGSRLDMKLGEEEVVAAFYVGKDVTRAYRDAGLEDGVLDAIDDALEGRVSSDGFEEGSTLRLIAVEETALGLFGRYKKVTALEYRPVDPAEKPIRIYQFDGEEAHGYFDERGRQPYKGGWRSPIPGAPITSSFNPKRFHPVLKRIMPHEGTDFGAASGTPVFAAYRGTVSFVGVAGPAGNLVSITHPNGVITGYAHLSKFAAGIKVGNKVGTHTLVGYVGSTGRSTGPHLHLSAKRDGRFFDAQTLQFDAERVMPTLDRAAFLARKAELDARLDAIPLPEPPPEPVAPEPAPAGSGTPAAAASAGAPAAASAGAAVEDPTAEGEEPAPTAAAAPGATAGADEGEDLVGPALGGGPSPGGNAPPP